MFIGSINTGEYIDIQCHTKDLKAGDDFVVEMNSRGGCLPTALNIMHRLNALKKQYRVVTKSLGIIESAALAVFIAGDDRVASSTDIFMLHPPSITASNGSPDAYDSIRTIADMQMRLLIKELTRISSKDKKFWEEIYSKNHDVCFSGDRMYELGIVTELID